MAQISPYCQSHYSSRADDYSGYDFPMTELNSCQGAPVLGILKLSPDQLSDWGSIWDCLWLSRLLLLISYGRGLWNHIDFLFLVRNSLC